MIFHSDKNNKYSLSSSLSSWSNNIHNRIPKRNDCNEYCSRCTKHSSPSLSSSSSSSTGTATTLMKSPLIMLSFCIIFLLACNSILKVMQIIPNSHLHFVEVNNEGERGVHHVLRVRGRDVTEVSMLSSSIKTNTFRRMDDTSNNDNDNDNSIVAPPSTKGEVEIGCGDENDSTIKENSNNDDSDTIIIPQKLFFAYRHNLLKKREPSHLSENVLGTVAKYSKVFNWTSSSAAEKTEEQQNENVEFLTRDKCGIYLARAEPELVPHYYKNNDGTNDEIYKSELCRLAALYISGGYYIDVDVEVVLPYVASAPPDRAATTAEATTTTTTMRRRTEQEKPTTFVVTSELVTKSMMYGHDYPPSRGGDYYSSILNESSSAMDEEDYMMMMEEYNNYHSVLDDDYGGGSMSKEPEEMAILIPNFIACIPKHPIIKLALQNALRHFQTNESMRSFFIRGRGGFGNYILTDAYIEWSYQNDEVGSNSKALQSLGVKLLKQDNLNQVMSSSSLSSSSSSPSFGLSSGIPPRPTSKVVGLGPLCNHVVFEEEEGNDEYEDVESVNGPRRQQQDGKNRTQYPEEETQKQYNVTAKEAGKTAADSAAAFSRRNKRKVYFYSHVSGSRMCPFPKEIPQIDFKIHDNDSSSSSSKIPHILWFTYKHNILKTNEPKHLVENVRKTIDMYQQAWRQEGDDNDGGGNVIFLDDEQCASLISQVYKPLLPHFFSEPFGAYRSDICRIAALYLYGGYYFDVDMEVYEPYIPQNYNVSFVTVINPNNHLFFQSFLASSKNHPLLIKAMENMVLYYEGMYWVEDGLMGPRTLLDAYHSFYGYGYDSSFHYHDDGNYDEAKAKKRREVGEAYILKEIGLHDESMFPNVPRRQGMSIWCNHVVYDDGNAFHNAGNGPNNNNNNNENKNTQVYFYSRIIGSSHCPFPTKKRKEDIV